MLMRDKELAVIHDNVHDYLYRSLLSRGFKERYIRRVKYKESSHLNPDAGVGMLVYMTNSFDRKVWVPQAHRAANVTKWIARQCQTTPIIFGPSLYDITTCLALCVGIDLDEMPQRNKIGFLYDVEPESWQESIANEYLFA